MIGVDKKFGTVFLATDPVAAATIHAGRWGFGMLVGVLLGIWLLNGPLLIAGLTRVFTPWQAVSYPTRTTMELENASIVVKAGDPVNIRALLSGDVPRSTPLLLVAGDKLVLSPEGQHGKHGFILFGSDPKKLTLFGSKERKWAPPHATTTAYGRQPIVNPIVDGRMFFRGGNGIYCYDLRKQ